MPGSLSTASAEAARSTAKSDVDQWANIEYARTVQRQRTDITDSSIIKTITARVFHVSRHPKLSALGVFRSIGLPKIVLSGFSKFVQDSYGGCRCWLLTNFFIQEYFIRTRVQLFQSLSRRETLSALETLLTSAVRSGDVIVYISIRQVVLLAYFRFDELQFCSDHRSDYQKSNQPRTGTILHIVLKFQFADFGDSNSIVSASQTQ